MSFELIGSGIEGGDESDSMLINFGDIAPGESKTGYWIMTASLDGEFTEFKGSFSHSNARGGAETSLIKDITYVITQFTAEIISPEDGGIFYDFEPIYFEGTAHNGTEPYSYEWRTYGRLLSSEQFFDVKDLGIGLQEITLKVTDKNDIIDTDTCTIKVLGESFEISVGAKYTQVSETLDIFAIAFDKSEGEKVTSGIAKYDILEMNGNPTSLSGYLSYNINSEWEIRDIDISSLDDADYRVKIFLNNSMGYGVEELIYPFIKSAGVGSIHGYLIDSTESTDTDKIFLPGTEVLLYNSNMIFSSMQSTPEDTYITDSGGKYEFNSINPGYYIIIAKVSGKKNDPLKIRVENGIIQQDTLVLDQKFQTDEYVRVSSSDGMQLWDEPRLRSVSQFIQRTRTAQILSHESNSIFADGYYWWYVRDKIHEGWTKENYLEKNTIPIASISFSKLNPKVGKEIKLDAFDSYDSDGYIKYYSWDLNGDGIYDGTTTSEDIFYYWDKSGSYNIKLEVTDNNEGKNTVVKNIVVYENSFFGKIKNYIGGVFPDDRNGIDKDKLDKIKSDLDIHNYPYSDDGSIDTDFYWRTDNQLAAILNKEMDPKFTDFTYGTYIINSLHNMKLVDSIANRPFQNNPLVNNYFGIMADTNVWVDGTLYVSEEFLTGLIEVSGGSGIGIGLILMLPDIAEAGIGIKLLDETFYRRALWYYFELRSMGDSPETAFGSSPIPLKYSNQETQDYFEKLWTDYGGDHISSNGGLKEEFKDQIKNDLRSMLSYAFEQYQFEIFQYVKLNSPGELRVYDSQNRVTGLVNGQIKEEIPNSFYDNESETVFIFNSTESYRYEVKGTDIGTYGLDIASVKDGSATIFYANDIPTNLGQNHRYTINWDSLSGNENGVTVQTDANGDGIFEQTIITDNIFNIHAANFTYTPSNPVVNEIIIFNASSSNNLDKSIVNYEWNFGDGDIINTKNEITTHLYTSKGDFTVILNETYDDGTTKLTYKVITTISSSDITPPSDIINLNHTAGTTWINWTWTNPLDTDFNHTEIYLDGIFQKNTSKEYFNATHLTPNTEYEISTRTVDDLGNINETWVNDTATTLNTPPVSNASGPYTGIEGQAIIFNASASYDPDPGDNIVSFEWDFNNDGATDATGIEVSWTWNDDYAGQVNLTVTDSHGENSTDTTSVTILNAPPVVEAGNNQTVNEGDTVSFTGDFTDPGTGDTHSIEWNFGDGTGSTGTLKPTHVYADNGTYTVTLTVTDDDSASTSDTLNVIVENVAPIVDAGVDMTADEGDIVSFAGNLTDPGTADTHLIEWDFGDGTPISSGTLTPTHTYADNGTYTVNLTVIDDDGASTSDTLFVTVNNVAPVLDEDADQTVQWGDTMTFSRSFTDPGDDSWTAEIDWGDGSQEEGILSGKIITATHVYSILGEYICTLTVLDDDGGVGSGDMQITVTTRATELEYIGDLSAQYSDYINLKAQLNDPGNNNPLPDRVINFILGTQTFTATTGPDGIATTSLKLDQPAGSYDIKAEFAGDESYIPDSDTKAMQISKEDAEITYTGDTILPTIAGSIDLRATLEEIDTDYGDLTEINVNFNIYKSNDLSYSNPVATVPSVASIPVTSSGMGVGTATATIDNLPEDDYMIMARIVPNDYYLPISSNPIPMVVYEPTDQFTTGGGWIWDPTGSHGNFGFNVKYNKKGKVKGNSIYVYRLDGLDYIVKSNAWIGLAISDNTSTFQGKAVLQIFDPVTGELQPESSGNFQFTVESMDNELNGNPDNYKITVLDKDGLEYHNATGSLEGGNIVIHDKKSK